MPSASLPRNSFDPALFPFVPEADPARAFNARAVTEGWAVRSDTRLVFDSDMLRGLVGAWRERCRPGHLPSRADFTLLALKPYLRDIVIVEVVREGERRRFRHKLLGSNASARLGEMTGRFTDEVLPAAVDRKTVACYEAVVDSRCPLRIVTDFDLANMTHMRGEAFAAPLAEDGVTPNVVLSVFAFTPRPSAV